MYFEDYLWDAFDIVSAWDIPEEDFAQAVNAQARLMAGGYLDDTVGGTADALSVPLC